MEQKDLVNNFIDDVLLDQKEILLVFGNGMSIKTSNDSKNGSEPTSYYIGKFKDYIRKSKVINGLGDIDEINEYSKLAEIILKNRGLYFISKIYRNDLFSIFKNQGISIEDSKDALENLIKNNNKINTLKKVQLNEGLESFGKISNYLPLSARIITSNFDPFLEIVLKKNDTQYDSVSYSYNLEKRTVVRVSSQKIFIEHYHGYWLDDTAHTELDKMEDNKEYFKKVINDFDTIYVFGFGGWDDSFSLALKEILTNNSYKGERPKIHWAFYSNEIKVSDQQNKPALIKEILKSNNVNKYFSIDTNILFPSVLMEIRTKKLLKALENYSNTKKEKYKINNSSFFKNVPAKIGTLWERKYDLPEGKDIPEYIVNKLNNGISFIFCSKFGMGKTTVMQNIFIEVFKKNKYPIFLSLAHFELSELINANDSIAKIILENELNINIQKNEFDELIKIFNSKLKNNEVILFLDSIDESIYKIEELETFKGKLIDLDYPIVTSIRLEFHDFIDNAKEFNKWNYEAIELLEWDKNTVRSFLNEKTDKNNQIDKNKILKFRKLSKRPLFINLLLQVKCIDNVKDNIASLYYHRIFKTLEEAFKDENNDILKKEKAREFWNLINNIAISIYLEFQHYKLEKDYKTKPRVVFSTENLRLLVSRNKYLDYSIITDLLDNNKINELIVKIKANIYTFFHRSLFEYLVANGAAHKIIKDARCSEAWDVYQTDEVSEYFVQEVEREQVQNSTLKKLNFFKAFNNEFSLLYNAITKLKDIQVLPPDLEFDFDKINSRKEDYYIKNKLQIKLNDNIIDYSERLEEVLYYVGKFKDFWTDEQKIKFSNYCKFFFYNSRLKYDTGEVYPETNESKMKPAINSVYYRTSAISLSRLENNHYIYDYLSYLFLDYISVEKDYFYIQVLKDIKYYGKEELEKKCIIAFNKVLNTKNEDDLKPLDLLKIFSLIISVNYHFDKKNPNKPKLKLIIERVKEIQKYLYVLINHAHTNKWTKFRDMLEGIEFVFKDLSFDVYVKNDDFNLKDRLKTAINKRNELIKNKKLDSNIFRIVNSFSDKIPYLEIDYYCGHIIIDTKKKYYYNNKYEIKEILESCLTCEITSINIKYNVDFQYNSKLLGEKNLEELTDNSQNKTINCSEKNIEVEYIIKPEKFPKTGFFIDNRKIREYLKYNSKNKKILNLFAYTCSLGAIAKKNGASKVINVENKEDYLKLGKKIYKVNDITINDEEFQKMNLNPNNEQSKISNKFLYEQFDIIILDMAEIAPVPCNFNNTAKVYKEYNIDALKLLNSNGGILITSCCSHGFSRERFKKVLTGIVNDNKQLELVEDYKLDELIDHPKIKDNEISDYLKIYVIKKKK